MIFIQAENKEMSDQLDMKTNSHHCRKPIQVALERGCINYVTSFLLISVNTRRNTCAPWRTNFTSLHVQLLLLVFFVCFLFSSSVLHPQFFYKSTAFIMSDARDTGKTRTWAMTKKEIQENAAYRLSSSAGTQITKSATSTMAELQQKDWFLESFGKG